MALSEEYLNDDIHPIDIVETLAEHHDWDFDRVAEDQIAMVEKVGRDFLFGCCVFVLPGSSRARCAPTPRMRRRRASRGPSCATAARGGSGSAAVHTRTMPNGKGSGGNLSSLNRSRSRATTWSGRRQP